MAISESQNSQIAIDENVAGEIQANTISDSNSARNFHFISNNSDFEKLVEDSFTKIINNEVETVKFPHTLTVKQREFIHKKAQDLSLSTRKQLIWNYRILKTLPRL